MVLLFACHGAASFGPAHSQIQIVVRTYVICYLALIVGVLACAAVCSLVRWLRGGSPPGAPAGKVTRAARELTIDDWWDRLGDE